MGQPRLKDPLPEPVETASTGVDVPTLHRRPETRAPSEALAKLHLQDQPGEDAKALKRWAGSSAIAVVGLLAVAGATGHLVAGLLVVGGLAAGLTLLVAWGNWILDNTVTW